MYKRALDTARLVYTRFDRIVQESDLPLYEGMYNVFVVEWLHKSENLLRTNFKLRLWRCNGNKFYYFNATISRFNRWVLMLFKYLEW